MELPKTYINKLQKKAGFSLLEVLMVLAMLGFIASATVLFSLGFFQSEVLESEESLLISVLQTARSKAMHNMDGMSHGVVIDPYGAKEYIAFSGSNFSEADPLLFISIPRSASFFVATGSLTEIVFSQLSGEVVTEGMITLIDSNRNVAARNITINYEGAIY